MNFTILGASGFIGNALWRRYQRRGLPMIGTYCSNRREDLVHFDFRSSDLSSLGITQDKGVVVFAGFIPQVDVCEREKEATSRINVDGTLRVMRQAAEMGHKVVFLSSDYVFDGQTGQYSEESATCPCTEYGRQKSVVEAAVAGITEQHLIVRLSKIFSLERGDNSLLDQMASKLSSQGELLAAEDQVFCPTYINDVLGGIESLIDGDARGLVNLCSPEAWNRYDLAVEMADGLGVDRSHVRRISLNDLPHMAYRPKNTSLVCLRIGEMTAFEFTPIRDCIRAVAANWR